jgi:hypothetical protein
MIIKACSPEAGQEVELSVVVLGPDGKALRGDELTGIGTEANRHTAQHFLGRSLLPSKVRFRRTHIRVEYSDGEWPHEAFECARPSLWMTLNAEHVPGDPGATYELEQARRINMEFCALLAREDLVPLRQDLWITINEVVSDALSALSMGLLLPFCRTTESGRYTVYASGSVVDHRKPEVSCALSVRQSQDVAA